MKHNLFKDLPQYARFKSTCYDVGFSVKIGDYSYQQEETRKINAILPNAEIIRAKHPQKIKGEFIHPELGENEHFLGNSKEAEKPALYAGLKTMRYGVKAFDINHNLMTHYQDVDYKPVFIHSSEYNQYNLIMDAEIKAIRRGDKTRFTK